MPCPVLHPPWTQFTVSGTAYRNRKTPATARWSDGCQELGKQSPPATSSLSSWQRGSIAPTASSVACMRYSARVQAAQPTNESTLLANNHSRKRRQQQHQQQQQQQHRRRRSHHDHYNWQQPRRQHKTKTTGSGDTHAPSSRRRGRTVRYTGPPTASLQGFPPLGRASRGRRPKICRREAPSRKWTRNLHARDHHELLQKVKL